MKGIECLILTVKSVFILNTVVISSYVWKW